MGDDELRAMYEEDRAAASSADARDSAHILIQVNDAIDETAALKRITHIAARVTQGDDFAQLPNETSEEHGSAAQSGSSGRAGNGDVAQHFEEQ